jgi:hypothetical protein
VIRVFQELIFSTSPWVQCGRTRIKWDMLVEALDTGNVGRRPKGQISLSNRKMPQSSEKHSNERFCVVKDMQYAREQHINQKDAIDPREISLDPQFFSEDSSENFMISLLLSRRGFGGTDPRDVIFSRVGFATDGKDELFTVDYSKTAVEIFENSARYIAKIYGIPTLLKCKGVDYSLEGVKNLASWVPDWSRKTTGQSMVQILTPEDTPKISVLLQEPGILGCIFPGVDTVLFTSSTLSEPPIPIGLRQRILMTFANFHFRTFRTMGPQMKQWILDDLWTEVFQVWRGIIHNGNIIPPVMEGIVPGSHAKFVTIPFSAPWYLLLALTTTKGTKCSFVNGKRLARMASGRVAFVPASTQEGDIIPTSFGPGGRIHRYMFNTVPREECSLGIEERILQLADDHDSSAESWKSLAFHEVTIISERRVLHCKFNGECFEDKINALEPLHEYFHDHTGSKDSILLIYWTGECLTVFSYNGGLGGYKAGIKFGV